MLGFFRKNHYIWKWIRRTSVPRIARIEKMENLDAHSADFRQFFLMHYETLCVRAFRLVHDRKLSEDIVQDVFLMLWERREEIDFSRPVLPYLMTAVRNRSIDFLRSRKSHGDGTCGLDTLDGYVRRLVADRCEDEFDLSQLRHEIDDGVSQLSEQCRRVFLLSRETGRKTAKSPSSSTSASRPWRSISA